jgi:syntaxin 16
MQHNVRKNIERSVAQQLQNLGNEFRRGHKAYLAKLKGQTIEDYRPDLRINAASNDYHTGSGGFFDDDGFTRSQQGEADQSDPRFSAAQTLQLVMAERISEEREKAITQVAESVGELAEIFKEIQVLVIDQGSILDRIDYNIEQAADRVGNAVTELHKANNYQKKSRTMLCIYLLLVLCGFMVSALH